MISLISDALMIFLKKKISDTNLPVDALEKHINTVQWKGRSFAGNSSVPLHHQSTN
jgi:antitoxin component of RelBE/YafQ-DinJ toxin-antitoxin module